VTPQGYKRWWSPSHNPASSHTIRHSLVISFPTPKKKEGWKEEKNRKEKREKRKGGNIRMYRVLLLLPPQAMAEHDSTPSTVMQGHMQNLAKQGFMTATELMTYRVPEDPTFPVPVEGDKVSFLAFYKNRFGTPLHQYYGLELYNLTPSGVLHIAGFMTLCESYPRIDPKFNLWN
jgi:hypothetical protein